ncbi:hypothetical protein COB55_00700 [Candidatus Wolfebacteria bacterium]|nr:MAG: hypothetical protein COB55_00700 [Candidatus Wolfebacteria bacterium]
MAKAKLKTTKNKASVAEFLNGITDPEKKRDAKKVLALMKEVTKEKPMMWGENIVGFGEYHYKYASGREGDFLMTGFAPRAHGLSIYIMPGYTFPEQQKLLKKLGPHTIGKSCLLIKHLNDIHLPTLKKIIEKGYRDISNTPYVQT